MSRNVVQPCVTCHGSMEELLSLETYPRSEDSDIIIAKGQAFDEAALRRERVYNLTHVAGVYLAANGDSDALSRLFDRKAIRPTLSLAVEIASTVNIDAGLLVADRCVSLSERAEATITIAKLCRDAGDRKLTVKLLDRVASEIAGTLPAGYGMEYSFLARKLATQFEAEELVIKWDGILLRQLRESGLESLDRTEAVRLAAAFHDDSIDAGLWFRTHGLLETLDSEEVIFNRALAKFRRREWSSFVGLVAEITSQRLRLAAWRAAFNEGQAFGLEVVTAASKELDRFGGSGYEAGVYLYGKIEFLAAFAIAAHRLGDDVHSEIARQMLRTHAESWSDLVDRQYGRRLLGKTAAACDRPEEAKREFTVAIAEMKPEAIGFFRRAGEMLIVETSAACGFCSDAMAWSVANKLHDDVGVMSTCTYWSIKYRDQRTEKAAMKAFEHLSTSPLAEQSVVEAAKYKIVLALISQERFDDVRTLVQKMRIPFWRAQCMYALALRVNVGEPKEYSGSCLEEIARRLATWEKERIALGQSPVPDDKNRRSVYSDCPVWTPSRLSDPERGYSSQGNGKQ